MENACKSLNLDPKGGGWLANQVKKWPFQQPDETRNLEILALQARRLGNMVTGAAFDEFVTKSIEIL